MALSKQVVVEGVTLQLTTRQRSNGELLFAAYPVEITIDKTEGDRQLAQLRAHNNALMAVATAFDRHKRMAAIEMDQTRITLAKGAFNLEEFSKIIEDAFD